MSRIRVIDLAKELNQETKVVMAKLLDLGISVKTHFNALEEKDSQRVRALFKPSQQLSKAGPRVIIRRRPAVEETAPVIQDPAPVILEKKSLGELVTPDIQNDFRKEPIPSPVVVPQPHKIEQAPITETPTTKSQHSAQPKISTSETKPPEAKLTTPTTPAPVTTRPGVYTAVIVRKAEPGSVQNSGSRYPQRRDGDRSSGAPRPHGSRPYTPGSRPGNSGPGGASKGAPSSYTPGGFRNLSTGPSSSLPMPGNSRKDAPKKKLEDEKTKKTIKVIKGKTSYEQTDNDFMEELYEDSTVDGSGVRTVIPNRKKGSVLRRRDDKNQSSDNSTKLSKRTIRFDDSITVQDLALAMSVKSFAVIKTLKQLGSIVSASDTLDIETAVLVAQEFDFEVQNVTVSIQDILKVKNDHIEQKARAPIVTIMGHVDHGKTSLLDSIRKANVASREAGGITQHIGAYQVTSSGKPITFIDTPGHEAFTSMRARGAKTTDIIILVVAADDGVMPQTVEAISHAQSAKVPIIVAINKIDKPNVQLERIQKELADRNVISEEWGGDTLFVKVSAKTGEGLDLLLENILLQAEVLDLKAPPSGPASGVVLEAKLDKSRGVAATLLVQSGCLKTTDWIVAGTTLGRVRAMFNDKNQSIKEAYPSTPIEILGLNQVPQAGDIFTCVANESIAKEAVEYRLRKLKEKLVENSKPSVENMFAQMQSITQDTLNIIIKADTHGSAEALRASILKLQTPEIKTHIVHWAVGGITETDVQLAHASKACIFGFSVRPDKQAALLAERDHITCETYTIIYELIDRIKELMSGRLSPTKQEKVLGRAEIRNIFSVPKIGNIAGVSVLDGKIVRSSQIRVIRDGTIVYTGKISSLKRFKDDAKEVLQGFECGLGVENFNDLKLGDIFESFTIEDHKTALGI